MFKNIDLAKYTPPFPPSIIACYWYSDSESGSLNLQIFGSIFCPNEINAYS
jgi:hypothetical protein